MILGFFFLFHFLEALEGREGFFAKKGGVSLVRNRDLRPAAKANPTIQQAFERFQKYNRLKNLSQGSLDFYAAKGRSFFRFLGNTEQPITTITEETVEDYIFYMKDQQLHDTTINTNLRMVRAFLYWCMEKGYLEKYPIRLVRADDPIKEPYTTDELQKLLKEPDCKTCSFAEYRNADYVAGVVDSEDYQLIREDYSKQYDGLRAALQRAEAKKVEVEQQIREYLNMTSNLEEHLDDFGFDAQLVKSLVQRIEVSADKRIRIVFGFQDVFADLGKESAGK